MHIFLVFLILILMYYETYLKIINYSGKYIYLKFNVLTINFLNKIIKLFKDLNY